MLRAGEAVSVEQWNNPGLGIYILQPGFGRESLISLGSGSPDRHYKRASVCVCVCVCYCVLCVRVALRLMEHHSGGEIAPVTFNSCLFMIHTLAAQYCQYEHDI